MLAPATAPETHLTDRALRQRCRVLFDALWTRGATQGVGARERLFRERRELCYLWLAAALGMPSKAAHFSVMPRRDLRRALALLERSHPRDVDAWLDRERCRAQRAFASPSSPAPPRRIGIAAAVLASLAERKEASS